MSRVAQLLLAASTAGTLVVPACEAWPAQEPAAAGERLPAAEPAPRVIAVSAERFRFVPARIRAAAGESLLLRLESRDVAHGFALPELAIEIAIPAAGAGSIDVPLVAPGPGRYAFQCAQVCGAGHAAMRGVLIVTERSGTRGWRRARAVEETVESLGRSP
jgi:cytochrome c oxidase subunit 2